jgi:hypothetical protein
MGKDSTGLGRLFDDVTEAGVSGRRCQVIRALLKRPKLPTHVLQFLYSPVDLFNLVANKLAHITAGRLSSLPKGQNLPNLTEL